MVVSNERVYGVDNYLPPLPRQDSSVTFDPEEKASIFALVDWPHSCFPEPLLTSVAFKSSELRNLHYLNTFDETDPNGCFLQFFKGLSESLAPKLAVICRVIISISVLPVCLQTAILMPFPKGH